MIKTSNIWWGTNIRNWLNILLKWSRPLCKEKVVHWWLLNKLDSRVEEWAFSELFACCACAKCVRSASVHQINLWWVTLLYDSCCHLISSSFPSRFPLYIFRGLFVAITLNLSVLRWIRIPRFSKTPWNHFISRMTETLAFWPAFQVIFDGRFSPISQSPLVNWD